MLDPVLDRGGVVNMAGNAVTSFVMRGMSEEKAWTLANRIDSQGAAEVWCGPLEQAELYHQQLGSEGLTMAPLERC